MDFIVEEELCEQAYEVWRHYACPACEGSAPPARPQNAQSLSTDCEGPCSVVPLIFYASLADGRSLPVTIALPQH